LRIRFFVIGMLFLLSCSTNMTTMSVGANYSDFDRGESSAEAGYFLSLERTQNDYENFAHGYAFSFINRRAKLDDIIEPVSGGDNIYAINVSKNSLEFMYQVGMKLNLSNSLQVLPFLAPAFSLGLDRSNAELTEYVETSELPRPLDVENFEGLYAFDSGYGIYAGIRAVHGELSVDIRYFHDFGGFNYAAGKSGYGHQWRSVSLSIGYIID
jgi:hypothetical protein